MRARDDKSPSAGPSAPAGDGPTVRELAKDVLREAGRPMSINDIIERIERRSGRKVKKDTLGALFSIAVRKGDTFVKTAPGVFGLKAE